MFDLAETMKPKVVTDRSWYKEARNYLEIIQDEAVE